MKNTRSGIKKTRSNHTGTKHGQIVTVKAENFGLGYPSLWKQVFGEG